MDRQLAKRNSLRRRIKAWKAVREKDRQLQKDCDNMIQIAINRGVLSIEEAKKFMPS